jgi:pimeloyl-ACP methyl ester carboxylesterase
MQLPVQERIQRYWETCVTPEFMEERADFLQRILELGMATPTPMETFGMQFGAVQSFDTYDRLPQIKSPTLILHGNRDILVPVENAEILHERIPGSQVRIIEGTGHCFFWERSDEVIEEIVGFLSGVAVGA